jgi:hypothetical protein
MINVAKLDNYTGAGKKIVIYLIKGSDNFVNASKNISGNVWSVSVQTYYGEAIVQIS